MHQARRQATLVLLLCASAERPPLQRHDVPHDGNCLFSAVALSAALVDNQPSQARARALRSQSERLRAAALDVLCPAGMPDEGLQLGGLPVPLLIEPLGSEGITGYCRRMREPGQWGSTAEVLALSRVLQRPIRVHTSFSVETYSADEKAANKPLSVCYENSHYQAVTEPHTTLGNTESCEPPPAAAGEEAAVAAVLDSLHARAARADPAYFDLFASSAVFLGTDPAERLGIDEFRMYGLARFAAGNAWEYLVLQRHITIGEKGEIAWFDERLKNAKLGGCRGTGVLAKLDGEWKIMHYSLSMTIPNDAAHNVVSLVQDHIDSTSMM
mmetsp:Transcript_62299/g.103598  ORF Transcript_62299/g.103598 Transcript_62299/m.103598 type:complete len:327 (-) Transcript_62299:158-1138(-)|eukprot:CAMPEP_0119337724 /NCGR_PEP_ID=MMETSP1333-20130426/94580_1 /TAXON_ID=418940 /ORGANISM="Scyphosphaera apsteinii, Strain RCC1455" /LENGTH=326 /DNA_ID=CAMNT_0007348839 /DNA_START=196 /DNA_END=1176 /DNA_ORIENTATION=+